LDRWLHAFCGGGHGLLEHTLDAALGHQLGACPAKRNERRRVSQRRAGTDGPPAGMSYIDDQADVEFALDHNLVLTIKAVR
jgi:hypothetical protein